MAYAKLDQMKQERLTNEKIFQQTNTKRITSQGVIRETNDAAKTKKEDSEIEKKAVEDFMKTYMREFRKMIWKILRIW